MTKARYSELLGRLLDGPLSEADAEELRRELAHNPDRLRDVREHLMFSDLLAQELTPQRSHESFWQGIQTRLGAEPVEAQAAGADRPRRLRFGSLGGHPRLMPLAVGVAAGILIAGILAMRWRAEEGAASFGPDAMLVSLEGEAVCSHCVLHQTDECRPVVRIREEGREKTLFFDDNAVYRDFSHKQGCCRKPVPVLAKGVVHTEDGRPHLAATRLEVLH